jgi:hypothetical protein
MNLLERAEARRLVEAARSGPPSYSPEVERQLRLADLLIAAVDRVEQLERALDVGQNDAHSTPNGLNHSTKEAADARPIQEEERKNSHQSRH